VIPVSGVSTESSAFEQFLSLLDSSDRERAGARYEELRGTLIRLFRWRSCSVPEDLADEALRRAIARSAAGEPIEDITRFVHGVARLIALEDYRQEARREVAAETSNVLLMHQPQPDRRMECLDRCLETLPQPDRELIVSYYSGSGGEKIENRRLLAGAHSLSIPALRVRAHRMRERLESCLFRCLEDR
jgi:DNA-directed RNA polymerase specialized sigma24 family protein